MQRYNFTNPLFLLKIDAMTQRFYFFFCLLFLVACDDGDIITVDLDFDKILKRCDNFENSYLIYDTKDSPSESLSLIIEKNPTNELLFTEAITSELPINASTTRFIYRTYNRAIVSSGSSEELCSAVPPSDLVIQNDYEASSGIIEITSTFVDDDEDGIPSVDEGRGELDEDGEYSNAQDSDGDEIPDYLDQDDDNDNVLTINEIDTSDSGEIIFLDTDNDNHYNHLDKDDDGDGIDTILEDEDGINGPINDIVIDTEGNSIARYLYDGATDTYTNPGFIYNIYKRIVTTSFTIKNFDLEIINSDEIDFGTFENSFQISNEPED